MKWLIISDEFSSLNHFIRGEEIKGGSPVPGKFLEFLLAKGEKVILVTPKITKSIEHKMIIKNPTNRLSSMKLN
jgi:hypothetical protein